jgi:SAM-dependent methyltransferase
MQWLQQVRHKDSDPCPPPSAAEISRRIGRFERWHYQFEVGGILTPIADPTWVNRHVQRKHYFWDPLVGETRNLIAGKRVLDLGCNAGYWALAAIEAGCAYVMGMDARPAHIEQASTIFDLKGVPRDLYTFVCANFFDYDLRSLGHFDVVLCLGIFYHVAKPMELLERISQVNTDLLLLDTKISRSSESVIEIHHDPLDDPRMSADYSLVFVPSAKAIDEMVGQFGYQCTKLKPSFDDWTGCPDFHDGDRRAFICAKSTQLTQLALSSEPTF